MLRKFLAFIESARLFLGRLGMWRLLAALLLAAFLAGGVFLYSILQDLPSLGLIENREVAESTKIYDRTGEVLLYEIYGEEKRTVIPFEQIPKSVKQATIAIEDGEFYNHAAFDIKAFVRAVVANLIHGFGTQGGSTITQQLAKNAFLSPEKTITRKIRELALAFQLERLFTKDEILTLYLNQIPYGANAYGIEAAGKTYFQKSVTDLSLAQVALLVSLPKAPSYYSPWGLHLKELLNRKNLVLERMEESGYITKEERVNAEQEKIIIAKQAASISAPHFVMTVQDYLNAKYGEEFVRRAGLKVITTLDWTLQQTAEAAIRAGAARNTELYKGKNAALVAQDTRTGQIVALVGSKDYFDESIDGQFNIVTQGLRQPGSAIKPFAYLTAFTKGYTPETVLFDVKTEFDATKNPENSYQPENFDELFRGPINMRNALAQSVNIPAVKTLYLVSIDNLLKLIRSFGITTLTERSRYGLSLVLGGGEVRLIDLIAAYSVLSQGGVKHNQVMVLRIEDRRGQILEEYRDVSERVIEENYPRLINEILSDSSARAPLFHASLSQTVFPGYEVAIKTGTTNDYRDAWAIGYTPTIAAGVWAGNSDNTPMERHGASILAAIPILHSFLADALKTQPPAPFARPSPIITPKPVLNGDYIISYQSGGTIYPQIHSILYYLNRRDPTGPDPIDPTKDSQFENWERPIIEWAQQNIPGFIEGVTYNQPIPSNAVAVNTQDLTNSQIVITTPQGGSFISSFLTVAAHINAPSAITRIDVYLNEVLLESRLGAFATTVDYQNSFSLNNLQPQNKLKINVLGDNNFSLSKEIIVYSR